jgi:hypothetical protein
LSATAETGENKLCRVTSEEEGDDNKFWEKKSMIVSSGQTLILGPML